MDGASRKRSRRRPEGRPRSGTCIRTAPAGTSSRSLPQLEGAKQAEVDKKIEAIAKQKGLATGLKASFEFRQYIGTHTDTFAHGPMTADEIVKAAEK